MADPRRGERLALAIAAVLIVALGFMGWVSFTVTQPPGVETDTTQQKSFDNLGSVAINRELASVSGTASIPPHTLSEESATLLVHVRRGDTGESLPNQDVWYCRRGFSQTKDFESSIEQVADTLRTDANGDLSVEFNKGWMTFFARRDHLIGRLQLLGSELEKENKTEGTLELLPERSITIRAVDQSGRAVPGILIQASFISRLSLASSVEALAESGNSPGWRRIGRTTKSEGSVLWKDLALTVRDLELSGVSIAGVRLRARVPGHEEVSIELRPLPAHGSKVDLRLPSGGSLTVRLLGPHGNLLPGKRDVALHQMQLDRESGEWKAMSSSQVNLWDVQTSDHGLATFPAIALGQTYLLAVQANPFFPEARVSLQVAGPSLANPSVTRDLILGADHVLLRGRALDASGDALGNEYLKQRIRVGGTWLTGGAICQDDGRFTMILPGLAADTELEIAEIFHAQHESRFDLQQFTPFKKGLLDLGDITFAAEPVLVAGRAIPAANAACTDYSVVIEHRSHAADLWERTKLKWGKGRGDFSITGIPEPGDYRLQVIPVANCHLMPKPVEFVPGMRDLEVRLERGHTLVVIARVPGSDQKGWINQAMHCFEMDLSPTGGPALEQMTEESSGRIGLTGPRKRRGTTQEHYGNGLLEGSYRLEVRIKGAPSPFRTMSGIQVPGPFGKLARADLDLTQDLKEIILRGRSADGSIPKQGAQADLLYQERIVNTFYWPKGEVSLLVLPGAMDLWVRVPGYMPVLLQSVKADQDVLLTPSATSFRASLADSLMLPEGAALRISLQATSKIPPGMHVPVVRGRNRFGRDPMLAFSYSWPTESSGMLNPSGQALFDVHRAGPQTITLELIPTTTAARTRWNTPSIPITDFSPKTFDLQPSTETQTLTLQVTQTAIDTALRTATSKYPQEAPSPLEPGQRRIR